MSVMKPAIMIVQLLFTLNIYLHQSSSVTEAVRVLEFQRDRLPTTSSEATYQGFLDKERRMDSISLCARFQLFILHGWATFFHLEDTTTDTVMMLVGELWIERVRPVIARNWNFQLLKDNLRMFRWYHICFTYDYDSKVIKTYIDGKLSNYQDYNVGRPVFGNKATVGQGDTPERSFSGKLSQVNVWDRALDEGEILSLSTCDIDVQGNYISWEEGWTLNDVFSYNLPLSNLCKDIDIQSYFWFPDMYFDTGLYLCDALGAEQPPVNDLEVILAISDEANNTYPEPNTCSFEYWTSFSDTRDEGIWRYEDGQVPDNPIWLAQEPNGLHFENCAVITINGMADIDCKVDMKCVACIFKSQPRFSLLGTCQSELRNVFFIAYQKYLGEVYFMGYGEYYIRKAAEVWLWVDDVNNKTIARMEPTKPDFPMGRRWWILESPVCDKNPGDRRLLLLSPCDDEEFTCDDGSCIEHYKRCDLKYDCSDNSDEAKCRMIARPEDYQRHLPPRSNKEDETSLPVIFFLSIETMAVKTMEMAIDVLFELTLTWFDNRLQYLDLKVNDTLNILPLATMKTLWTPEVTFVNAIGNHHTHVDEFTTLMIKRRSDVKMRDEAVPAEEDIYPGNLNSLAIRRKYGIAYDCDFHLALYPFDVQQCSMHLRMTSAPKSFLLFDAINSSAKNLGESLSAEYYIGDLEIVYNASGTYSEVRIMVPLSRLSGYAILNIYLPTLVLLVISYVTLFIRVTIFEVRMMGALTVQLVIATLFSQVSTSLPKTSYFKMVDVWLIFCIGLTFLVIIFHAIIDNAIFQNQSREVTPFKMAWPGSSPNINETLTQNAFGKFVAKASKISVLVVFILFNIGYWGYIIS